MLRLALFALMLPAVLGGFGSECIAAPPNILFLVTDDQRADTIAALGNPHIRTPNLDQLIARGFVFRSAYCMGSTMPAVCNPSRHMFLSGKSLYRYDPKEADGTFGDVFRRAGYETYHLSKRGNEAREYHKRFEHSQVLDDQQERTGGHHGRAEADAVVEFLRTRDRARPFCAYVGFAGPHDPRVAADEWLNLYRRDQLPLPRNFAPFHPFDNGEMAIRDEQLAPWPRTPDVVRRHLHDYYACISSIDHHIGRIFAALAETGDADNTLVVFTSDHGLAIGSHGLFGKQSLYEDAMRSPLVFSGPGIPRGESAALVYLFDIFPTLCELSEVPPPEGIDGKSLAPILRHEKPSVRDAVFLAYRDVMRSVRVGDWKLIRYPQVDVTQLFDLAADPDELHDLAGDPGHAGKARELLDRLAREQAAYGDTQSLVVENPRPAAWTLERFQEAAAK